jgi:hypothetical protein
LGGDQKSGVGIASAFRRYGIPAVGEWLAQFRRVRERFGESHESCAPTVLIEDSSAPGRQKTTSLFMTFFLPTPEVIV